MIQPQETGDVGPKGKKQQENEDVARLGGAMATSVAPRRRSRRQRSTPHIGPGNQPSKDVAAVVPPTTAEVRAGTEPETRWTEAFPPDLWFAGDARNRVRAPSSIHSCSRGAEKLARAQLRPPHLTSPPRCSRTRVRRSNLPDHSRSASRYFRAANSITWFPYSRRGRPPSNAAREPNSADTLGQSACSIPGLVPLTRQGTHFRPLRPPCCCKLRSLNSAVLSRRALPQMWNGEAHLFSHKTRIGKGGEYVNEDVNPLYSAIALIGLLEHGSPDTRDELLVGKTLDALHLKHAVGPSPALGGSLIWAASLAGDRRRREVLARTAREIRLSQASSMELGLLLSGLMKCHEHTPQLRDAVAAALPGVRDELLRRFNRSGSLFSDRTQRVSLRQGKLAELCEPGIPDPRACRAGAVCRGKCAGRVCRDGDLA